MSTSKQLVSVDEYDRMVASGQLTENDRVELIRGEIVEKMSIGPSHNGCVNWLARNLTRLLGDAAIIGSQNPVRLEDSEPEPDISVARPRVDFYRSAHPRAKDVLLTAEVAESSLDFDRDVKRPIYAEAGIGEYWIVNLVDECVEVHRDPRDGEYRDMRTFSRGESVSLLAFPDVELKVDEILG